jgi:hypothetical protein
MNHPLLRSSVLALILVLGLSGASVQSSAGARVQPAPAAIGPAAVIPAAGACFSAALSGTSEVPPNDSAVTGYATVVLAPSQQSITAYISYTGELSGTETAAHFHLGAPGLAGPVVYPLPAGNPKTLTQTLTLSDTSELLAGNLYVNIHSTGFGDGEIRGQLRPSSACFSAKLDGAQEVPPNNSTVTGTGIFGLSPDLKTLVYDISYTGALSGTETAAHFHRGAPGVIGPVVYPLPAGNPKTLTQTLTISDVNDLLTGQLYVNIHSTGFGDGEIRGQINPASTCFSATLSGAEEVPPTGSTASGYGRFMLSADRTLLSYNIQTTGVISETMAHIHTAFVGTNGPVSIPLPLGATKVGTATLTLTNTAALLTGQFYVNVHTEDNQDGDIRGQIGADACQQLLPVIIRADAGPVLANGQTP